jgi:hypothetical protein
MTARPQARRGAALVLAVFAIVAIPGCREITVPLQPGSAVALIVFAGDTQTAEVGATLAAPIIAKVVDNLGNPVPGRVVDFRVTKGGGSVYAGSSISDANGLVVERWALGWMPNAPQELEARGVSNITGDSILYARFTATAIMPPGVDNLWLGSSTPVAGNANDFFNMAQWYSHEPLSLDNTVMIPGAAEAWPVIANHATGTVFGTLIVRPGGRLGLLRDQYNQPEYLYVTQYADISGTTFGDGILVLDGADSIRGSVTHLQVNNKVKLSGNLNVINSPGDITPDGSINFTSTGQLMVRGFALRAYGYLDDCNLSMGNAAGFVWSPFRVKCTEGSYTAGTMSAPVVAAFKRTQVSGTHTVIIDGGGTLAYNPFNQAHPTFQNLRTRNDGDYVEFAISSDTLLVKGSLYVDSGILYVGGHVLRVLGNVTIAADAALENQATIEYAGTLSNAGTITGHPLVHTP